MEFGPMIIEDGLIQQGALKHRKTVRAIIKNDKNELLMVYSKWFDDYTFPGGGVKQDENEIDGLKRELKEELGALSVEVKQVVGQIQELRYGITGTDDVFLQTSKYYLCEILQFGKQELIGREILHGIEPRWVKAENALMQNMKVMNNSHHQVKGLKTVLIRENNVLRALKGESS